MLHLCSGDTLTSMNTFCLVAQKANWLLIGKELYTLTVGPNSDETLGLSLTSVWNHCYVTIDDLLKFLAKCEVTLDVTNLDRGQTCFTTVSRDNAIRMGFAV